MKFFHLITFADNNPETHIEINPENTKTANGLLEGCSGSDSVEPQSSHGSGNSSDPDVNRNQTEKNIYPSCSINNSKQDNLEDSGDFEKHSKTLTWDEKADSQSAFEDAGQGLEFEENGKFWLTKLFLHFKHHIHVFDWLFLLALLITWHITGLPMHHLINFLIDF